MTLCVNQSLQGKKLKDFWRWILGQIWEANEREGAKPSR